MRTLKEFEKKIKEWTNAIKDNNLADIPGMEICYTGDGFELYFVDDGTPVYHDNSSTELCTKSFKALGPAMNAMQKMIDKIGEDELCCDGLTALYAFDPTLKFKLSECPYCGKARK